MPNNKAKLEEKKKLTRTIAIIAACVILFVGIVAAVYYLPKLANKKNVKPVAQSEPVDGNKSYASDNDPIATITMENGDIITVQLYPKAAPNTVANFVELANSGFYDGITFHRVIENFMIQAGDPTGTGKSGSGKNIVGEFTNNGHDNFMTHVRGVISMARRGDSMDSASSQFFIMHAAAQSLDGDYAAFGEVLTGMDAVDKIAAVETDESDKPLTNQVIKSIRVETNGIEYSPEYID